MLNNEQRSLWEKLEATLTRDQLVWLYGYVSGRISGGGFAAPIAAAPSVAQESPAQGTLRIYFATETGNAKGVAQQLAKAAKKAGWKPAINPVTRVTIEELARGEGPAVFVAATHGEGDPPETAVKFFDRIKEAQGSVLSTLKYTILGLGDKSYPDYCQFARDLDTQLERLGAVAFMVRRELDVDFAQHVETWMMQLVAALSVSDSVTRIADVSILPSAPKEIDEAAIRTGKGYSRLDPVIGVIKESINLNDRGSKKETFHIEISYKDDLHYAPGDAIGIIMSPEEGAEPITPRLYSIASAPSVHQGEIHLTVAHASHKLENGEMGFGLCSHYLATREVGDKITFYVQQNQMFKLPDDERDIIMIGPGTGIAPFRSFVWERAERGATGRNWLFFGEQHAHCDFLYQAEWIEHMSMENLDAIDLAFSRDQYYKVYVQHRMQQKADALFQWIRGGACIYVCGTKDPMSRDVEAMLLEIIGDKIGADKAEDYLADMQDSGRYVKDVY